MDSDHWNKITTAQAVGFGAGMLAFLVLIFASEPGFVFALDHTNLLFHEAGHPFVGLFSRRLEPYGGTMGQLVFPVVLAISFARKGQALAFAASVIWFFENFLNIARYMADARALQLPLLGGGDHDWNTIFSRWHVLSYNTTIAAFVKFTGWFGILAACVFVAWRVWEDRKRPEESVIGANWKCEG